jgi:RNA polymerase sigma factor (sigma-70 family)
VNVLIQLGDSTAIETTTWTRLVQQCRRWTGGDEQTAEDLAQETLIEAWRNQHKLNNTTGLSGYEKWLSAIARNVCLRWYTKEKPHPLHAPLDDDIGFSDSDNNQLSHDDPIEETLETAQRSERLQDAIGQLDPLSQAVVTTRYLEGLSQAQTAARLHLTETAVAVRLHRAKAELRVILSDGNAFQETPLWCPLCGQHRLIGRAKPEAGELILRCPQCEPERGQYITHHTNFGLFDGVKGFKPIYSRLMKWSYDYYTGAILNHSVPCLRCGATIVIHRRGVDNPVERGLLGFCDRCSAHTFGALNGILLYSPEGRKFQQHNPRLRLLPETSVEVDGQPAIVLAHESVTTGAKLLGLFNRDSYQLLKVVTHD